MFSENDCHELFEPRHKQTDISSFGSQNLVILIFDKTPFWQRGNTNHMEHILSKFRTARQITTPLKSIIKNVSKYCIS